MVATYRFFPWLRFVVRRSLVRRLDAILYHTPRTYASGVGGSSNRCVDSAGRRATCGIPGKVKPC
jgi:hypothetical protein